MFDLYGMCVIEEEANKDKTFGEYYYTPVKKNTLNSLFAIDFNLNARKLSFTQCDRWTWIRHKNISTPEQRSVGRWKKLRPPEPTDIVFHANPTLMTTISLSRSSWKPIVRVDRRRSITHYNIGKCLNCCDNICIYFTLYIITIINPGKKSNTNTYNLVRFNWNLKKNILVLMDCLLLLISKLPNQIILIPAEWHISLEPYICSRSNFPPIKTEQIQIWQRKQCVHKRSIFKLDCKL